MCERNGTTYAKLQDQSRRGFLKTTSAASATLALPAALGAALMSLKFDTSEHFFCNRRSSAQ